MQAVPSGGGPGGQGGKGPGRVGEVPSGLSTDTSLSFSPQPGVRSLQDAPQAKDAMKEPLEDAPRHAVAKKGKSRRVFGPMVGTMLDSLGTGVLCNRGVPPSRAQPVANRVAVQQAWHDKSGGSLGAPVAAETLGTGPVSGDTLATGTLLDPENVEFGPLSAREGVGVVRVPPRGEDVPECQAELRRQGVGHLEAGRLPWGVAADADHPKPGAILWDPVLDGIEDTPSDVILHGLELQYLVPPPCSPGVGGYTVALLHEECNGSASFDGVHNLIQQGCKVVLAAQHFTTSGPRLAGGPRHIKVQGGTWQVLCPDIAVEACGAVLGKAKIFGWSPNI